MITAAQSPVPQSSSASHAIVRVLRWTFVRDDESVVCELGLSRDATAYELGIQPPWNPLGLTIEMFDDAVAAFQRQAVIERTLIRDGWSLERFDSSAVRR